MRKAALPDDENEEQYKRRVRKEEKARKKLASSGDVCYHGSLHRWVWASPRWWLPHWRLMEAEVRGHLLLLSGGPEERPSGTSVTQVDSIGAVAAKGRRATALPLNGASVRRASGDARAKANDANGATPSPCEFELRTSAGDVETLRVPVASDAPLCREWLERLRSASRSSEEELALRRRMVAVDIPSSWEQPR